MRRNRPIRLLVLVALGVLPALSCGLGALGGWLDHVRGEADGGSVAAPYRTERPPSRPEAPPAESEPVDLAAELEVEGRRFQVLVGQDQTGKPWSVAFSTED